MGKYEEALERARKGMPMDEVFPELKESDDERIRKEIIRIVDIWTDSSPVVNGIPRETLLAYLEKQKEQKPVQSDTEKELVLHDTFGYENGRQTGQNEGIKLVLNNPEKYGLQKEQKSAEWSEHDREMKLKILKYLSTRCNVNEFEEVEDWLKSLRPQPMQEWSEEDENMLNRCICSIEEAKEDLYVYKKPDGDTPYDREISLLKSLRPQPHWKPSKEQIDALNSIILNGSFTYVGQVQDLISLKDDLKKL